MTRPGHCSPCLSRCKRAQNSSFDIYCIQELRLSVSCPPKRVNMNGQTCALLRNARVQMSTPWYRYNQHPVLATQVVALSLGWYVAIRAIRHSRRGCDRHLPMENTFCAIAVSTKGRPRLWPPSMARSGWSSRRIDYPASIQSARDLSPAILSPCNFGSEQLPESFPRDDGSCSSRWNFANAVHH